MDDTQNTPETADTTASTDLVFPTGADVYDSIMGNIEPDLLSSNIEKLDAQYEGETEEQRQARYDRYEQAYARYDEEYAIWEANLQQDVVAYRRAALQSAEAESRSEEQNVLAQLEQGFDTDVIPASPSLAA